MLYTPATFGLGEEERPARDAFRVQQMKADEGCFCGDNLNQKVMWL